MPSVRVQPLIAIFALVGLFAISVLVGYVAGQAFLAPSTPSPRSGRTVPSAGEADRPAAKPPLDVSARPPAAKRPEPGAGTTPPAATVVPTPPSAPAPARPSESGAVYRVQVGAYISQVNAEARLAALRGQGFDAYVTHSGGLYRVQVGAFAVRENAQRMADRLRAAGYEVLISP